MPIEDILEKLRALIRAELRSQERTRSAPPVELHVPGLVCKPLYKAVEVCSLLGVSRQTLHAWSKQGLLRTYKVKSRVFYLAADVEKLIGTPFTQQLPPGASR